MENLADYISKKTNSKAVVITVEEFEDGVGVCVGQNYVRNSVWMTQAEALEELNEEIKISTGILQAKDKKDAERQVITSAEKNGVNACSVKVVQIGNSNRFSCVVRYII